MKMSLWVPEKAFRASWAICRWSKRSNRPKTKNQQEVRNSPNFWGKSLRKIWPFWLSLKTWVDSREIFYTCFIGQIFVVLESMVPQRYPTCISRVFRLNSSSYSGGHESHHLANFLRTFTPVFRLFSQSFENFWFCEKKTRSAQYSDMILCQDLE